MKSICIKTNNKYIIDYLLKDFSNINLEDLYLSNSSFKLYDNIIIHYKGNQLDLFMNIVCDILTKCIIFFHENNILKNMINYNYFYFSDNEKRQILDSCIDLFNYDEQLQKSKYKLIFDSIFNYLENNKSIIINGFINFRLKDYKDFLDENIDFCVNNFLIEREYYEFINLLHLYVNSKECNFDTVHLVYVNNESILIDDDKNIISTEDNIFSAKYLSDISFSSNDYCLNTLLNILPKRIFIHLVNNYEDEFINTLKLIFENRVFICTDCDICRVYRLTNNIGIKK